MNVNLAHTNVHQYDFADLSDTSVVTNEHYLRTELYSEVRENPEIFDFLQAGSLDGIWYWDLTDLSEEWMNAKFWETMGYDPKLRKHSPDEWQDLIHPEDLKTALENFTKHCEDPNHPYDQLVRYTHADGSTVWIRCRGIAIRDEKGTPIRMLGAHNDVTELKNAELQLREQTYEFRKQAKELKRLQEELTQLAIKDDLTGLYNRRVMQEKMEDAIEETLQDHSSMSVMLLDIDHFKKINDLHGHQVGDDVLAEISQIMKRSLPIECDIIRYGGEEFVIIAPNQNTTVGLRTAEKLRETIQDTTICGLDITISTGVTTLTYKAKDSKRRVSTSAELLLQADKSLYHAKNTGRNQSCHFDSFTPKSVKI